MDRERGQLSVWVCRELRLVSGLTRRTTCQDVVRVLLDHRNLQRTAALSGPPDSYRLVEKWRGFERTLPGNTRILRLWSAWGAERHDVRFLLLRKDASLPSTGPRTAEARVVPSRDGGAPGALIKGSGSAVSVCQDKQRRVVRKAFRKLDRMNRKTEKERMESLVHRGESRDHRVERMESLVHRVVSQDHTLRQQLRRIRELDRDIERYEAGVHRERVRRHGANYVQDTYLAEGSTSGERRDARCVLEAHDARTLDMHDARCASADALAQLEFYLRCCEEVERLQEELTEREALLEGVTMEIQEELNQRWMKRQEEEEEEQEEDQEEEEEQQEEDQEQQEQEEEEQQEQEEEEEQQEEEQEEEEQQEEQQEQEEEEEDQEEDQEQQEEQQEEEEDQEQEEQQQEEEQQEEEEQEEQQQEEEQEEEPVRTQLDASLDVGLRLEAELDAVQGELDRSLAHWETRERHLLDLLAWVEAMELEEGGAWAEPEEGGAWAELEEGGAWAELEEGGAWAEPARGRPGVNDSDSDTGMSSMNSQDSDSTPLAGGGRSTVTFDL